MRKSIIFILQFVMVSFACLSQTVFERDGLRYALQDDLTLKLVKAEKGVYPNQLVIPDSIEGYPVASIAASCFYGHNNLVSVELPKCLVDIEMNAFGSTSIDQIRIPASVRHIGDCAFSHTQISSLHIEDGDSTLTFSIDKNGPNDTDFSPFGAATQISHVYLGRNIECNYRYYNRGQGWVSSHKVGDLNAIFMANTITNRQVYRVIFSERLDSAFLGPVLILKGFVRNSQMKLYSTTGAAVQGNPFTLRFSGTERYFNKDGIYYGILEGDTACAVIDVMTDELDSPDVTIPEAIAHDGKTFPVTNIYYYAMSHGGVKSVSLPGSIESISSRAFEGNRSLQSVKTQGSIRRIGDNAFYECRNLEEFMGFESIERIGSRTFFYCTAFFPDALPPNIKYLGDECFFTSGIRTVRITPQLQYGSNSFYSCRVHQVLVEEGVKQLSAGFSSDELHTIVLPSTLESCNYFFSNNLRHIYSYNPLPPAFVMSSPFNSSTYRNAILHIPEGCRDIYLRAPVWKDFLQIHAGINDVTDDNIKVSCNDGILTVTGIKTGERIFVYSLDGRVVYSGAEHQIGCLDSGTYIIVAGSYKTKLLVR